MTRLPKIRIPYRPVSGILLLDKPLGLSSNDALQKVRRLFAAKKAGHGGSLDPLASGLLPIFFGEATKFSHYLLSAEKTYLTTAKLGVSTTTADAEGEVTATQPVPSLTPEIIQIVLNQFLGTTQQIPSMYSALKHQGKPLYELARQGIEVAREARTIHITQLDLISYQADELTLKVTCSKGTYIRNLVEDMGKVFGCGAHVKMLRRLKAGNFVEKEMTTLEKLQSISTQAELDQFLLPMDQAVMNYPTYALTDDEVRHAIQGKIIASTTILENFVRLYTEQQQFLGLGQTDAHGVLRVKRLLATYP